MSDDPKVPLREDVEAVMDTTRTRLSEDAISRLYMEASIR